MYRYRYLCDTGSISVLFHPSQVTWEVLDCIIEALIQELVWIVFLLAPAESFPHHTKEVGSAPVNLDIYTCTMRLTSNQVLKFDIQ